MKIYVRQDNSFIEDRQYGGKSLEKLYNTWYGRVLSKFILLPVFSTMATAKDRKRASVKKIAPFIEEYKINMDDFEEREYGSFSDFFTHSIRPGKRPVDPDPSVIVSPADSKVLCYDIGDDLKFTVKGSVYTPDEIVGNNPELRHFAGGKALVFRLSMDDYHHYCHIDSGKIADSYEIKGKLHTVSSISSKYKIYKENHRIVNILETDHFGRVVYIEVGALLVGRIKNNGRTVFGKGQEKGYFEQGGSTIVLFFENGRIKVDADILEMSGNGIETKVKMGERIGVAEYV
ncbi:MAG: phosphatidylserine decarboxylase [Ruminococcaceae bacterium]|nr:phosphatidylserine decarboxylase [Oscillospiraceae bacterium]